MRRLSYILLLCLFFGFAGLTATGQQPQFPSAQNDPCAMPAFTKIVNEPNLFNEQQEEWLGDIMDQDLRRDFNVVEDPGGYLQKLGERLLAQLPPTTIHYHFAIIDSPELNSFGVAGGRIYIYRRMIAFTRTEGELASLVGHEIGHAATHQVAIQVSGWLRELGVTSIGDRQDVIRKWNLFKDNAAKLREHGERDRFRDEQLIADRVGLYAMTRAGYDPAEFVAFADRSLETKGKTGGFWSDFFGTTSFQSKRLREIIRNSAPLLSKCIAPYTADAQHFTRWQQEVIASKLIVAKAELPGLVRKIRLQPPLRGDIQDIEFSNDGKYMLAQDESSIFVLTREPLANLFRLDALDTYHARFSPDSRSVVFYDKELRVEKWDIATQQRTALHAVTVPDCLETALSPSGDYLACIAVSTEGDEFGLQIIDVNADKVIYARKKFYTLDLSDILEFSLVRFFGPLDIDIGMHFSPDSRYFVAGHHNSTLAFDLKSGTEVHLPSRVQWLLGNAFAFISPEEIAGVQFAGDSIKLVRARFPSGEKIDEFKLPAYGKLYSTTQSNYLLMRPVANQPVGIIDLKQKKLAQVFRSPGFGVYGEFFAGEQANGEIGLFTASDEKRIAHVQLPESPLAASKVSAFSPDGKWLAVSGDSRGALWRLETGDRVFYTRGFEGAYFDHDQLVAQFPKFAAESPSIVELDPVNKSTRKLYDLDAKKSEWQQGKALISLRPEKESDKRTLYGRNTVLEVRDAISNSLLWERKTGKSIPSFYCRHNTLTLIIGEYDAIKAKAKENPSLSNVLKGIDSKRDAYLIEVYEASTGKPLGSLLVDTGKLSFKVRRAVTAGDTVLVTDSLDRTLVYSLKTGAQRGKLPGRFWDVSQNGDRVLVGVDRDVTEVYDASTLQPVAHFSFPAHVANADFTADGANIMVLTADQTVYELKATTTPESASAAEATK
ncbi:MAG TPA: M48 family metalloprotease [Candidatus Angelobacter sp.]|nr:M48 family metalloprotease [Candidatus Angelobacter sp.]